MKNLSGIQQAALAALARIAARRGAGADMATAREVGAESGQSSDGAAYTLRSLVRRGLVAIVPGGAAAGGYRLTPAGAEQARSRG
jgi:DNA-binding IscR family transcriptional regulator